MSQFLQLTYKYAYMFLYLRHPVPHDYNDHCTPSQGTRSFVSLCVVQTHLSSVQAQPGPDQCAYGGGYAVYTDRHRPGEPCHTRARLCRGNDPVVLIR